MQGLRYANDSEVNIIDEIRNDIHGAALLKDWLGEGADPVPMWVAERRAYICELCPENRPGNMWEVVKHAVADWIKGQIEVKRKIQLSLTNENKLGMCSACGCCNRLKCWVPIEHIKEHTPPETLSKLDSSCWIRGELKNT